ncbi:MAG TPA: ABC transporter substrate-binding protein [Burkholderiaceae bacterium]|nr:ABC transporter substrate-binding protein [Burkholderiaceae bacterium]HRA78409.1 ABC transporter substrate-binding protein [Burkholderiaceae bacterium]
MAGVVAAGLPLAAGAQAPEKQKLTIAVGGKAAFYYLPLTIAEQRGYFKEEGLNVEIVDFAGGSAALRAVVGGSADVVSGAYEHTINLQANRQFFTAFVLQGRAPAISLGVSSKAKYQSPADLKGMKIGVSAPGSSTNMMVTYFLTKNGMKASDVSFIGVGTGNAALAAIRSGQIDALSNVDPVMTMLEQKGDVKIIADTRTLEGTNKVFGGPMPAGCLYAPEDFVKKNPNTVQALTNAMVKALRWLQQAGPSDIIRTVPEAYLLGDRGLYLASYNNVKDAVSPDGLIPEVGAKTTLKAMASFNPKVKAGEIDLSRTYTNEFTRKALAKIR